jgi:hypothetical protein
MSLIERTGLGDIIIAQLSNVVIRNVMNVTGTPAVSQSRFMQNCGTVMLTCSLSSVTLNADPNSACSFDICCDQFQLVQPDDKGSCGVVVSGDSHGSVSTVANAKGIRLTWAPQKSVQTPIYLSIMVRNCAYLSKI